MSVTIESTSKWQPPSVLHLLPFSKNNAGTTVPNSNNSMVATQSNQHASYSQEVNNKGLPNLGSSLRGREKPRSKSAAIMDDRIQLRKQEQQQRLFRASSERLSRPPKKPSGGKGFIERARSEYVMKSDRKLTQEVVTFAIKDINEQILGQSVQNEKDSLDFDKNSTIESGRYKVKPILKPVVKLHEGRWPQSNARFWRSSTISPGEKELQRHKASLDAQLSAFKRSKMVKLNVKDLPRSQTPIGENDPDKLNMKQVIAFLQSSGDVRGANDDDIDVKKRIKSSNNVSKGKLEHSKGAEKTTENKDNSTALLIAAKSRRKDESSDNFCGMTESETTHPDQSNKPDFYSSETISNTGDNTILDPLVKARPNSYNGKIPSKLAGEDKHHQDQTDNNQRNPRPKSIQFLRESTEFRIPARIHQIRESTVDNRPFRLHHFLTLVSNTPEEEALSKRKVNGRVNANNSRFTSTSAHNNNTDQSFCDISKSEDNEKQNKTYTDSKGFFLTRYSSPRNDCEKKKENRRRPKHTPSPTENNDENNGSEKIICLPTAHVDIDSDDDSNFINLPTVPSKATRKDLVLSAHGRAMLTKHFPQVETFRKPRVRPHSEKITLKRRLEKNGDIKMRPSTVKPKDLVEWAPVQDAERIFLSEPSAFDPSTNLSDMSNSNRKHIDTLTVEEEVPSNDKVANPPESPNRSENSPNHVKALNSSAMSKTSDDTMLLPPDNHSTETSSDTSKDTVFGKSGNGAKPKPESISPTLSDPVRLTLRKERNLTREKTYMVDMEAAGNEIFGQR